MDPMELVELEEEEKHDIDDDDEAESEEQDAVQGEVISIRSLRDAQAAAARQEGLHAVAIVQVQVRHAGALRFLIEKQLRKKAWAVTNAVKASERLPIVDRISSNATLVLDAIIPLLAVSLHDNAVGRELRTIGWSFTHDSRRLTDDNFRAAASSTGSLLRRHAKHMHVGKRDACYLADNLDKIKERVLAMQEMVVTIGGDH